MKRHFFLRFLVVVVTLYLGIFIFVRGTLGATNYNSGQTTILGKDEVIDQDYFAAGKTVMISGTVNGDAYVAGGTVIVDGTINGDLLVAGGTVSISGTVAGNVRSAGGQVTIAGEVAKNVTALGGSVTIQPPGTIGGSLVSASGTLSLLAPVEKGATITGGQVSLNSTIGGDVTSAAETLTLSPQAQVFGTLNYWSDQKASIASEAAVKNDVVYHQTNWNTEKTRHQEERARRAISGFGITLTVLSLLSSLVIGILFRKYLPVFTNNVTDTILTKPLESLGIGFLVMILMPFVCLLLLITLIGIPFMLALILALTVLAMFNDIFIAHTLAKRFVPQYGTWGFLGALVVIALIKMIPIVGWLLSVIAFIIGLGALLITKKRMYTNLRQRNLI